MHTHRVERSFLRNKGNISRNEQPIARNFFSIKMILKICASTRHLYSRWIANFWFLLCDAFVVDETVWNMIFCHLFWVIQMPNCNCVLENCNTISHAHSHIKHTQPNTCVLHSLDRVSMSCGIEKDGKYASEEWRAGEKQQKWNMIRTFRVCRSCCDAHGKTRSERERECTIDENGKNMTKVHEE